MLKPTRRLFAAVAAATPASKQSAATHPSKDYSKTLHLPRSTLPARALAADRPRYLQRCTAELYAWQTHARATSATFVLHDGPPYANGPLHIGHALNKILKDILCRFALSQGRRVCYVPGWDCHGLPIEVKALQALGAGAGGEGLAPAQVRAAARGFATQAVEEQRRGFEGWAVMGEWDKAYQTMEKGFEIRQLGVFKDMVEKGLVYRTNKPVYWSPSSRTALAEAELEYDDHHVSTAAFVKFKLVEYPSLLWDLKRDGEIFALIWTTTPWTLPANQAIAVHSDIRYAVITIPHSQDLLLVATDRIDAALDAAGISRSDVRVLTDEIPGRELVGGLKYVNEFHGNFDKPLPVIHGEFVEASSGTGLVHVAPGHGFDDYNACRSLDIPAFAPVDDQGCFTTDAFPALPEVLLGKEVLKDGNQAVLELLHVWRSRNAGTQLWVAHEYTHKYPVDWRTKLPVIIRSTAQWFADVAKIKDQTLKSLDDVQFFPPSGKSRLARFVQSRNEWCISRQRAWGVPIPALYNEQSEAVMDGKSIEHIIKVIEERGIDAWWTDLEDEPAWIPPHLSAASWTRGKDTMDVWFDSGTSWTSLESRHNNQPPADVYIEGTDQHRGWFQSSLLTYAAHQTDPSNQYALVTAPFKNLITHGFILDEQERKMSKSIGNVVSPGEIMNGALLPPLKPRKGSPSTPIFDAMGPDALRLWVASSDYTRDVTLGQGVLQYVHKSLHKYRVTLKFLLGVLSDHQPSSSPPPPTLADKIALFDLSQAEAAAHSAFTSHEPYRAVSALTNYITGPLSSFYFETAKDPLYAGPSSARLRAQTTCFEILITLLRAFSPVLPLLVVETLDHASPTLSPHLTSPTHHPFHTVWNPPTPKPDPDLPSRIAHLNAAHAAVRDAQESARAARHLRSGLASTVTLHLPPALADTDAGRFFAAEEAQLATCFVVSGARVVFGPPPPPPSQDADGAAQAWRVQREFRVDGGTGTAVVGPAEGGKCPRCWRWVAPLPPPQGGEQEEKEQEQELCGRCVDAVAEMGKAEL